MLYAQDLPFIVTFCIQLLSVGKSVVIGTQEFVSYTTIALTVLHLCIILVLCVLLLPFQTYHWTFI